MTNEDLKSLIDKLNNKKTDGLIHLRPLSKTVDFAKVWTGKPKPSDNIVITDDIYKFYFIKNLDGLYVATVSDMGSDLHVFVDNKYRGQGHLTKAMKETILFHLLWEREEQRITIDKDYIGKEKFKAAQKVAFSLGFEKTDKNVYVLSNSKYQTENYIDGQNTELTEERLNELKKKINYLGRSLLLIHSEVEIKLGQSYYTDELENLAHEVKYHFTNLEDYWFKSKKSN